ncbi:hypothetical protein Scep_004879 [Stephania cephalantha]|uniref:Uncharacterized protein n=1 Tax=Stephania cephalantha TaxID=152367 RepID=A0AAP0PX07_9MAGN
MAAKQALVWYRTKSGEHLSLCACTHPEQIEEQLERAGDESDELESGMTWHERIGGMNCNDVLESATVALQQADDSGCADRPAGQRAGEGSGSGEPLTRTASRDSKPRRNQRHQRSERHDVTTRRRLLATRRRRRKEIEIPS